MNKKQMEQKAREIQPKLSLNWTIQEIVNVIEVLGKYWDRKNEIRNTKKN